MGQRMKKEWGQGPSDNMTPVCSHLVTLESNMLLLPLSGSLANCVAPAAPVGRCTAALRPHGRSRDSFPVCNLGACEWRPDPCRRQLWVGLGDGRFGPSEVTQVP